MSYEAIQHWTNTAADYPVLSHKATIELAQRIQALEPGSPKHTKLVNKLCLHNMRLVLTWVRQYCNGRESVAWGSAKSVDLLQEGYFGLRKAACKFDPKRGYTFATYANAWVRQAIGKYHVDTLSDIRVPESSAREIYYFRKHGKERNQKVAGWVAEAAKCADKVYTMTSLDRILTEDDGGSLLEIITEEQSLTHREGEAQSFNHDYCRSIMDELDIDPKIQDIIMTYGRRGNLETAMMKHKMSGNVTRTRVRSEIARIQAHVGA